MAVCIDECFIEIKIKKWQEGFSLYWNFFSNRAQQAALVKTWACQNMDGLFSALWADSDQTDFKASQFLVGKTSKQHLNKSAGD